MTITDVIDHYHDLLERNHCLNDFVELNNRICQNFKYPVSLRSVFFEAVKGTPCSESISMYFNSIDDYYL